MGLQNDEHIFCGSYGFQGDNKRVFQRDIHLEDANISDAVIHGSDSEVLLKF
jgi:hypothetical protein